MSEPMPPGGTPDPSQSWYGSYGQYAASDQYAQQDQSPPPGYQPYQPYAGPPTTASPGVQPGYQPYPYGYPAAGHYPYPNAYGPTATGRPGTVVAAAVLAYITAGFLIVGAIVLFTGASAINDLNDANGIAGSFGAEFVTLGFFNLIAAGLLIGGAVSMTGGSTGGRTMFSVGSALVLVLAVYWLARWASRSGFEALIFYALLFGALVIVALPMAWNSSANRWYAGRTAPLPQTHH